LISRVRPSFWKAYEKLHPEIQASARVSYQIFTGDPGHPSLRFKKLAGHDLIWSVRINQSVRALAERKGDTLVWFWIGSHNDFDKLFG